MNDPAGATLQLTPDERSMLDGEQGEGIAMAMRVVVGLARVHEAPRLVEIESAHIDGCLFHGQSGLDFASRLVDLGATVRVPTTLNVGSIDLLHPGTVRNQTPAEQEVSLGGRALMEAYLAMGASATWTCAPYQLDARPGLGVNVAWAESNAIAFCNSVLGARTDRYGDFLDICAAITGRAPFAGLHTDEARLGDVLVDVTAIPDRVLCGDLAGPLLGVTPEAATVDVAFGGRPPTETITLTSDDLVQARRELTTASEGRLDVVSVGTPHASIDEIASLAALLANGSAIEAGVDFYVSTGRSVWALAQERGHAEVLATHGVRVVTDTCTYVTSILRPQARVAMTNSGKWAHYAPGNLGVDVVMASLRECVESARAGRVVIDDDELR